MLQAHCDFNSVLGLGATGGDRCCLVAPWWQIWEHLMCLAYSTVRNRGPRPLRYNKARLYFPPQTQSPHFYGCIQRGFGGSLELGDDIGDLVMPRVPFTYQCSGITYDFPSNLPLASPVVWTVSDGSDRQIDCGVIHQQTGRYLFHHVQELILVCHHHSV